MNSDTPRTEEIYNKYELHCTSEEVKELHIVSRTLEHENQQLRAKRDEYESYIIKAQVAESKAVKGWEDCSEEVEQLRADLKQCADLFMELKWHDLRDSHTVTDCFVCERADKALSLPSVQAALKERNEH